MPIIDKELPALLDEQYSDGIRRVDEESSAEGESPHFFGVNRRRVDSLTEDVNRNLHSAESASLRLMDDVYRQTIFRAELAASTGSVSMEQAVDMAVKDFLSAGINCIQYRDGRMVNIATYAEMSIRTASIRSYLRGEADRRVELGIDTVLCSQYGACSNTCLPWQGKVYIDDVWGRFEGERRGNMGKSINGNWYMLLSTAVEAGLFHPNCRHTLSTWIEGVSRKPEPMDAQKIRDTAELERKQRRMEVRIRRLKRLAEGTLEQDKAKEYRKQVRSAQAELRAYISEHGDQLRRDYWREKTHDIPADANRVANPAENVILNEDEKAAILSYVSGDSYTLNAKLREGIKLDPHEEQMIASLDRALMKMPVYEGEVIRSLVIDKQELIKFAETHAIGNVVRYPAFTSTSANEGYNENPNVIMRIDSVSGRDLRGFNPEEAEILFPRNSRFSIESVSVEGGTWILKVSEIIDEHNI